MDGESVTPVARQLEMRSGLLCVLCGEKSNGRLEVVPVCINHAEYGEVETVLQHGDVLVALACWLKARDWWHRVDLAVCEEQEYVQLAAEMVAATAALERVARRIVGNG